MMNRLAAVVVVLLAFTSLAGAQAAADAGLTKGIAQVQDGHWDAAVSTLNDVMKRLSGADLAQAHLWLGIAHAQLDSAERGEQSFRMALTLDPRVSLARDRCARLWDLESGRRVAEFGGSAPAEGVALSPDGPFGAADRKIQVWDVATSRRGLSIDTPDTLTGMALAGGGRFLLAGGEGSVRIFELD